MENNLNNQELSGDQAILEKNASALKRALDAGWTLPIYTGRFSGRSEIDSTLLMFIVEEDWVEGWKLLSSSPMMSRYCKREILLRQIISRGRLKILEDIASKGWFSLNRLKMKEEETLDEDWYSTEEEIQLVSSDSPIDQFIQVEEWRFSSEFLGKSAPSSATSSDFNTSDFNGSDFNKEEFGVKTPHVEFSWIHALFTTFSQPHGEPVSNVDILKSIDILSSAHQSPFTLYPGCFKEKDKRRAGHNIWSYAVKSRLWSVAEHVWPKNWTEAGPRALEIFEMLLRMSAGLPADSLLGPPNRGQKEKALLFLQRWWSLESNLLELQYADVVTRQRFGRIWAKPWTWPLLLSLPERSRQVIFESWIIPDYRGQTAWHLASLSAQDPFFSHVLGQAFKDGLNLQELWMTKDAFDTRVIDTATLSLGYALPDEGEFIEANRRLQGLPEWHPYHELTA